MSRSFHDPCAHGPMPLINSIKDLLPQYNIPPSNLLLILSQLTSLQNNARFFTGHLKPLETVFPVIFGPLQCCLQYFCNLSLSVPGFMSVSLMPTCQCIKIYMMWSTSLYGLQALIEAVEAPWVFFFPTLAGWGGKALFMNLS
jgi:hypothetical protein